MNEFATSRVVADTVQAPAEPEAMGLPPAPQARDTLEASDGAPYRHSPAGPAPQIRLMSPQSAAKAVGEMGPGLEALLKLYKLLYDEPHATMADVEFHHWLSYSSLVPCGAMEGLEAQPEAVLAVMERAAQELSATWVRGRLMNEVVRFPCAPRRPTGADVPTDWVRAWLDQHDYRLVAICADGDSSLSALFIAAAYGLFDRDRERLAQGLERVAQHHAFGSGQDAVVASGCKDLALWAEKMRAGRTLEPLLHGLRIHPASMRGIAAALGSFLASMPAEPRFQAGQPADARALECLSRELFGLDATVVDTERGLGLYGEPGRALNSAQSVYLLRTAEHFDALIAACDQPSS